MSKKRKKTGIDRERYNENLKNTIINLWKSFGVDIDRKPKSKTKDFEKLFKEKK